MARQGHKSQLDGIIEPIESQCWTLNARHVGYRLGDSPLSTLHSRIADAKDEAACLLLILLSISSRNMRKAKSFDLSDFAFFSY